MANQEFPPVQKQRFTLFHLLGLVALAGILGGIILRPIVPDRRPKLKQAIIQISSFQRSLEIFKEDNGQYPAESNGLDALVARPTGATNWHQYLDSVPLDPWGHAYRYEFPGNHNTNSFDISSAGPDGKFDTKDDVGNWGSDGK